MPDHVVEDRPHRFPRRHTDFESLGAERLEVDVRVLEIETIADGADRGHASEHLERTFTTRCDSGSSTDLCMTSPGVS